MSAIVKTTTPFIELELLLQALDALDVKHTQAADGRIITERQDHYGNQAFILEGGRYKFIHDSSANREHYSFRQANWKNWKSVDAFILALEKEYTRCFDDRAAELVRLQHEEELRKIEEARQKYVESVKVKILENAKSQGYAVKEKKVGGKVQLVLVKHTY